MTTSNIFESFAESIGTIQVEIYATHLNFVNGNDVLYTTSAAKKGCKSFTKPFNKPQLMHHDKHSNPIGRIFESKVVAIDKQLDDIDEPPDVVSLKVEISDETAIANILKGLYLTCSVGSKATKVRCSACNQILTEEGLCEHEKGSRVAGKEVYWIIDEIVYNENSFVNIPADPYSRIVRINLGKGFIPYKEFLEKKDTLINEILMEDSMSTKKKKLSAEDKIKMSDSVFCGPDKTFPATDKDSIEDGIATISALTDLSDNTKLKILSGLYRRGKLHGVIPTEDALDKCPNLLSYRIDDEFSDEEKVAVAKSIEEKDKEPEATPAVAEPEPQPTAVVDTEDAIKDKADAKSLLVKQLSETKELDIDKLKEWIKASKAVETHVVEVACSLLHSIFSVTSMTDEIKDSIQEDELKKGIEFEKAHTSDDTLAEKFAKDVLAKDPTFYTKLDSVGALEEEVKKLKTQITDSETILNSKESEINKLLDDSARLEETIRQNMIDSIVDLKIATKELASDKRDDAKEKYNRRQINSLVDTINDLRTEFTSMSPMSHGQKIDDPNTVVEDKQKAANPTSIEDTIEVPSGIDSKFALFYTNRED